MNGSCTMNGTRTMNRRLLASFAAFALATAVGCGEEAEEKTEFLPSVSVTRVESVDLSQEIRASGDLRARFHTTIAAEVEGRVTGISVEEGGSVELGAVVLEIDPARRKLDAGAARARLAQARANFVKDRNQAERIRKLRSQSVASDQQLEEAETALLLARSSVDAERAALGVSERALADASVSAPFAGLVAARNVQLGEFVQTGDPLFEIVALDPLEVVFSLTELDTQLVKNGQTVSLEVGAFRDRTFKGVVMFVSPTIDPDTRTLRVKAEVSNTAGMLRPGLFARVSLGLSQREGVLMLPDEAVTRRADGAFVFRLADGDRVERVEIQTGAQDGERIEVLGPLSAGDVIVQRGHASLLDGAQVAVRENPTGRPAVAAEKITPPDVAADAVDRPAVAAQGMGESEGS